MRRAHHTVTSGGCRGRRLDARENGKRCRRVSPWTAQARRRSEDRPLCLDLQRWRVRDSRFGACRPRASHAGRVCRIAGSWPGQQTRGASWFEGGDRHRLESAGRRQERLSLLPWKTFEWLVLCLLFRLGLFGRAVTWGRCLLLGPRGVASPCGRSALVTARSAATGCGVDPETKLRRIKHLSH